jgi:hypothetical protein
VSSRLAGWRGQPYIVGRVVRAAYEALPAVAGAPPGHDIAIAWLSLRDGRGIGVRQAVGVLCCCGWREVIGSHQYSAAPSGRIGGFYPGTGREVEVAQRLARSIRLEHWFEIMAGS